VTGRRTQDKEGIVAVESTLAEGLVVVTKTFERVSQDVLDAQMSRIESALRG
jgi:hypothetical protein